MGIDDKNKQMLFDDEINYKHIKPKELKKTPHIKGGGFEMRNQDKRNRIESGVVKNDNMMHFKIPETKCKINDNIETQKALDIELKKKISIWKKRNICQV